MERISGPYSDQIEVSPRLNSVLNEVRSKIDYLVRGTTSNEVILFEGDFASYLEGNGRYAVQIEKGEVVDYDLLTMHITRQFARRGEIEFQRSVETQGIIKGETDAARVFRSRYLDRETPVILKPFTFQPRPRNGFLNIKGNSELFLAPYFSKAPPVVLRWVAQLDTSLWAGKDINP